MSANCPSPGRLLQSVLPDEARPLDPLIEQHVRHCARCSRGIAQLAAAISALRSHPAPAQSAGACLDELALARLLEGTAQTDGAEISHLAACARCRTRFASTARLLEDAEVLAEVRRIDNPTRHPSHRPWLAVATGIAATIAAVLFWPDAAPLSRDVSLDAGAYRERTITTTAAPRILGPVRPATATDSLRWSSVPGADLYRITFWRVDGTVAWTGEARDTVLPLPADVTHSSAVTLLWEVKARTGWDRWVVSDLVEFTLQSPAERTR